MNLVLLPGMDGTGKLFAPFTGVLPPQVDVTIIPLMQEVGVGYAQQAEHIAAQLTAKSVIIAESYSGVIALELASKYPDNIDKLVFIASFIGPPSSLSRFAHCIPKSLLSLAQSRSMFITHLLFGRFSNSTLETLFHDTMDLVSAKLLAFRLKQISLLTPPHSKIDVPCLCVNPSQDLFVSQKAMSRFLDTFEDINIQTVDGTHFLLQTNPRECWQVIQSYLL